MPAAGAAARMPSRPAASWGRDRRGRTRGGLALGLRRYHSENTFSFPIIFVRCSNTTTLFLSKEQPQALVTNHRPTADGNIRHADICIQLRCDPWRKVGTPVCWLLGVPLPGEPLVLRLAAAAHQLTTTERRVLIYL